MPPGSVLPKAFLRRKFRSKLDRGLRGEAFLFSFSKKLIVGIKQAVKSLVEAPILLFNALPVMEPLLRNFFSRVDPEGQAILTLEDQPLQLCRYA
jgi:hypothetical protein